MTQCLGRFISGLRYGGLLYIFGVLLAGCGGGANLADASGDTASAAGRTQLHIGIDPRFIPVSFDDGGQLRGIEADFGNMLADALGLQPVFVPMPFEDLRAELISGRIDIIMAGMSITEARRRMVAFTEPYMHINQQAMVRVGDADRFTSIDTLNQSRVRIAVETGTTGHRHAQTHMSQASLYAFPSFDDALDALKYRKVDVLIHDSVVLRWHAGRQSAEWMVLPHNFTEEPIAWAVRRTNVQLLNRINPLIARWHEDGTINRVLTRWLSQQ